MGEWVAFWIHRERLERRERLENGGPWSNEAKRGVGEIAERGEEKRGGIKN